MNLNELSTRARQILRDSNKTIFNETDIVNGINEGIARCKQIIKELKVMENLADTGDVPIGLPEHYHHLLSLYSASRCFFTDEQFQQSTILMNEFESKLYELKSDVENGDVTITDENGEPVTLDGTNRIDGVVNVYFAPYQAVKRETTSDGEIENA